MNRKKTFECFGLVLHGYSPEAVFEYIGQEEDRRPLFIVTANAEILLEAKRNPAYWNVLRQADLRLVDGVGAQLIGLLSGAHVSRYPGVDFADALVLHAVQRNWKVAIIGGELGNADLATWSLRERHPSLLLMGEHGGRIEPNGADGDTGDDVRFRITQFAPDILLVGFGHPKQEAWIVRHMADFPSVKIAVGVGGTIDYWSGKKFRAPLIVQRLGFEWLWRLVHEPRRWRRIFQAVCVFPLLAFRDRGERLVDNFRRRT